MSFGRSVDILTLCLNGIQVAWHLKLKLVHTLYPANSMSASTLKQYASCLRRLNDAKMTDFLDAKTVIKWIQTEASPSGSVETQNNFLSAIIHLLGSGPASVPYQEEAKRLKVLRDARQKSQALDKEVVPWLDILALEPKALTDLSSEDYLIYSLYTLVPPVRADYCKLVFSKEERDDNYISTSQPVWFFVFNEYKTSKTYGRITNRIPDRLKDILQSYEADGKILNLSENALTKRVISVFKKLGVATSITGLRHSYITQYLKQKRSILEKEETARQMMHSTSLQERYDIL